MVKQVIVIRKDLKMRRGKEIAQGAHASMSFLSHMVRERLLDGERVELSVVQKEWIEGKFTKVCVRVDDEESLMAVAKKAKEVGVDCHVITDAGLTEFGGVPTKTCLAVGPDESSLIDQVTGGLSLY